MKRLASVRRSLSLKGATMKDRIMLVLHGALYFEPTTDSERAELRRAVDRARAANNHKLREKKRGNALNELGGRPDDWVLNLLGMELATLYFSTTGKRPISQRYMRRYCSDYIRFGMACCEAMGILITESRLNSQMLVWREAHSDKQLKI